MMVTGFDLKIDYESVTSGEVPMPRIEGILHHELHHVRQQDNKLIGHLSQLNQISITYDALQRALMEDPPGLYDKLVKAGHADDLPEAMASMKAALESGLDSSQALGLSADSISNNYSALLHRNSELIALTEAQAEDLSRAYAHSMIFFGSALSMPTTRGMLKDANQTMDVPPLTDEQWGLFKAGMEQVEKMFVGGHPEPTITTESEFLDFASKQGTEERRFFESTARMQPRVQHAMEYLADDAMVRYGLPDEEIMPMVEYIAVSEAKTIEATEANPLQARQTHPDPANRVARQAAIQKVLALQKSTGCGRDVEAAIEHVNADDFEEKKSKLTARWSGQRDFT